MRLLRNALIGLVVLLLIAVAGAYLQPRHVIVERSVEINAPPSTVFALVNSLQRGQEWSPWAERDPDMEITYEGPESGVGNVMSWTSEVDTVGSGRQEIVESVENERVATELQFDGMGMAQAWFDLEPMGEGTRLTWGLDADMGNNPIGRWMGLMMDGMVGADYETGLANIRDIAEAG